MNARKTIASLIALSSLALIAMPASATISFVTGQAQLIPAPGSCIPGALTGFVAYAWDENPLSSVSLTADMINNPGASTSAIAGGIGGIYESHFLHFEGIPGVVGVQGTVVFNAPIDAVMFMPTGLDNTDASCGAFGTTYPTGYPFRGVNPSGPSMFSINSNVLTFNFFNHIPTADLLQVRVLTKAPAPGSAAALALAGLVTMRRRRCA